MSNEENLHAGHRERTIEKFLNNPTAFSEHELLEMLLFYSIPRKNTNDIAHKILKAFGSLDNVFNASPKELIAVDGVGEKSATLIVLFSAIMKEVLSKSKPKRQMISFNEIKSVLTERLKGIKDERFLLFLLDKNYNEKAVIEFNDQKSDRVSADVTEIANAIALHKPSFAIIAHNHPSGNPFPSEQDDNTTKQINLLCNLHNVELVDHVIVSDENFYSYHHSYRLSEIKRSADLNKILRSQGE